MRSRNVAVLLVLVLTCSAVLLFSGCGSDSNKPYGSSISQEETQFTYVAPQLTAFMDTSVGLFKDGYEMIMVTTPGSDIDRSPFIVHDTTGADSVNTSYSDGWHTFYSLDLATAFTQTVVDSVQYRVSGNAQESAVGAEELSYRHNLSVAPSDTSGSYQQVDLASSLEFSGLRSMIALVNGTVSAEVQTKDVESLDTQWRNYDIVASASELSFNRGTVNGWLAGCPISGTITMDVSYTNQVNSGSPYNYDYSVTASFSNGEVTFEVTSGDFDTTYTYNSCTP